MTRPAARLAPALAPALLLAACGGSDVPTAPNVTADVDPRLGIVVFDRAARAARSPAEESLQLVRVEATPDGLTHVLLGFSSWRTWGEVETRPGDILYRVVHPDGRVEERPPVPIGLPLTGDVGTVPSATGDFVVLQTGALASGQLARIHVFHDGRWNTVDYLRNDRPAGTAPEGITPRVRVFAPDDIVAGYDGGLSHWDGKAWSDIALPDGVRGVRGGPFDANGMRLFWFDEGRVLHTRILDRATRTLRGDDALYFPDGASFGDAWNWSGTPDAFVLELDAGGVIDVSRYAKGGFRPIERRPLDTYTLRASYGALRASRILIDDPGAHLVPLYQGAVSGPEIILPRRPLVTCPTECWDSTSTDENGTPLKVGRSGACLACVPRSLLLWALDLPPEGDTIHALYADDLQEGRRFYLMRLHWPQAAAPTGTVTDTAYPGEPATVPDEPEPIHPGVPRVRVLRIGRDDHSGAHVHFGGTGEATLSVQRDATTDATGRLSFGAVPPGPYRLDVSDDRYSATVEVNVTSGEFRIDDLVLEAPTDPSGLPADARLFLLRNPTYNSDVLLGFSGGTLQRYVSGLPAATVDSGITDGPVRLDAAEAVAWKVGDNVSMTNAVHLGSGGAIGLGGFVTLDEVVELGGSVAFPQNGFDGRTRQWSVTDAMYGRSMLWRWAVDLASTAACSAMWLWEDTTGQAGTTTFEVSVYPSCTQPRTARSSTPPAPRSRGSSAKSNGLTNQASLAGYTTRGCDGTRPCTLWMLGTGQGSARELSTTALAHDVSGTEVFWVEKKSDGSLGLAASSRAAGTWLSEGAALAVPRHAAEPLVAGPGRDGFFGRRAFWKETGGVFTIETSGGSAAPWSVIERARVLRLAAMYDGTFKNRYLVAEVAADAGQTDCTTAPCGVTLMRADNLTRVDFGPIAPDARFAPVSSSSLVTDEFLWNDCPGGPCRVVGFRNVSNGRESYTPMVRGRLPFPRDGELQGMNAYVPVVTGGEVRVLSR